jgi:dTMP kinase
VDIDSETGLARAAGRGSSETRLEEQAIEFHRRAREAYHELARREPQRFRLIDGRGTPEAIAAIVWEQVQPLLAP